MISGDVTCTHHIVNPRRACAARVTVVGLSVCVCRRLFWRYRLRGGPLAIPAASELRESENETGDFPETSAF